MLCFSLIRWHFRLFFRKPLCSQIQFWAWKHLQSNWRIFPASGKMIYRPSKIYSPKPTFCSLKSPPVIFHITRLFLTFSCLRYNYVGFFSKFCHNFTSHFLYQFLYTSFHPSQPLPEPIFLLYFALEGLI